MKKAGIILGIFFIVAALLVFFISTKISNKNEVKENNSTPIVSVDNENKKNNNDIQQSAVVEEQPTPQVVTQVETKVVEREVSSVKTIKDNDLSNLKSTHDVVTVISNKRILLIDENTSGSDKKTLTYCFDVLTPDNQSLVLFVTKSVYDNYKVQDRLKVSYDVYTNDSGIEFPLVSSVTSVD